MTARAVRKSTELALKLDGLDAELRHWRLLSELGGPLEKNQSQISSAINCLTIPIESLRAELRGNPLAVLETWTTLESRLLRLHEIWDYFRQKFSLRLVDTFMPYLVVADEFAWACYQPVHRYTRSVANSRREPPLTFLCASDTPFALTRGASYAHELRLTTQPDDTVGAVMAAMPIPVIGLPWFQVRHLPECLVIGHEVGHHVENDLRLSATLTALAHEALRHDRCDAATRNRWNRWLSEVFADVYGALAGGPAYGYVLADFGDTGLGAAASSWYPPIGVRIQIISAVLRACGTAEAAESVYNRWQAESSHSLSGEPVDRVDAVIHRLLSGPYPEFGGGSLTDVLSFIDMQPTAERAAFALLRGYELPAQLEVRAALAAAALAFAADPEGYVASEATDAVLQHVRSGVESGIRSAGRPRNTARDRLAGEKIDMLLRTP